MPFFPLTDKAVRVKIEVIDAGAWVVTLEDAGTFLSSCTAVCKDEGWGGRQEVYLHFLQPSCGRGRSCLVVKK
jgi:hypothetical protein